MKHSLEWHRGFEDGLNGKPFDEHETWNWMLGYFAALKQSATAKPQGDNK